MFNRLRTKSWLIAAAVVPALSLTVYAVAQKKAASAAAGSAAVAAATVDGEKITRGQVVDEMLKNQASNIAALEPRYVDKVRPAAASVGSLVVKKMSANGWGPTTVTRGEIIDWMFKDKPDILVRTVERMITERAVAHAAKKQGITLTAAEVNAQTAKSVDTARKNYHLEGKTDAQVLQSLGVRADYLQPFVRTQLYLEKMVQKDIEKKLGHAMGPSDFVEASHILVMVRPQAADEAAKEKAFEEGKKKITDIAEEIKTGKKTFEQAAQQYSEDGSKFKEGKLGLFPRGQMVPEFEQAAFSQEKGKVGQPVRTQYGWHLIRVDKLGSETTGPERKQVVDQMVQQRMQTKVQEIMASAKVVNTVPAPPAPANPMMMPQGERGER
jgi:parvulin-like peptidyl-prolyl isomerase